jgi:hypothetical protein
VPLHRRVSKIAGAYAKNKVMGSSRFFIDWMGQGDDGLSFFQMTGFERVENFKLFEN